METSTVSDIVNTFDDDAGSTTHNLSLEYSLNFTHLPNVNNSSFANITSNVLAGILSHFSPLEHNGTNLNETKTKHLFSEVCNVTNSTILNSIQPDTSQSSIGIMSNVTKGYSFITNNNNLDLVTTEIPIVSNGLSSMEKWFIATGSVIIAVIIVFCLNACIQYRRLFQKFFKRFHRRNEMVESEKRCHRDRDLLGGGLGDDKGTQTHIFLHRIFKHEIS